MLQVRFNTLNYLLTISVWVQEDLIL